MNNLITLVTAALDGKSISEEYSFITGVNSEWHKNSEIELKRKAENINDYFNDIFEALEAEEKSSKDFVKTPTADVEYVKEQIKHIKAMKEGVKAIYDGLETYKNALSKSFK